MKKFKRFISILITLSLIITSMFVLTNIQVSAEKITVANIFGTNVRVRTSKSTAGTSNVIDHLSNTQATVVRIEGDWLYISYNKGGLPKEGYIFNNSEWVNVYTFDPSENNQTFEQQLAAFPESYHAALRQLHAAYPNWSFIADPVNITLDYAVYLESLNMKKQVGSTLNFISWRSMDSGYYDWANGIWAATSDGFMGASREVIKYYMDPRNFLNSSDIFQFLQQGYSPSQTEDGVKKIIKGTFLENGYSDPENVDGYNGSYIAIIMEAARQSGVSPYILASKIRQEIGTQVNNMVSGTYPGYENLYNFFNIGAGNTTGTPLINGLTHARNNGWTSRPAAIIGGAKFLGNNYISAGQSTFYYQDFNVHNGATHQYAQAVFDAYNKGRNLSGTYNSQTDLTLDFYIPVFASMPQTISPMPPKSDAKNNYYFSEITVQGLAETFNMYTYSYTLQVSNDTAIKYAVPSGATYLGNSEYQLNTGENIIVLTVKSETGYTNDYTISVLADKPCKLYVNTSGSLPQPPTVPDNPTPPPTPSIMLGDPNKDGKINTIDLAMVQAHILGKKVQVGDIFTAIDIDKNNVINTIDLAMVQAHILGKKLIAQ